MVSLGVSMRWVLMGVAAFAAMAGLVDVAIAEPAPGKLPAERPVIARETVEAAEPLQRTPEEWQAIALENLNAMRDLLIAHSPIGLPDGDALQDAWLVAGYEEALALLPRVQDELGLLYVLRRYAIGFDDIHLSVHQDGPSLLTAWPGFVAARRGTETVVAWRADEPAAGQPPVGAVIRTCDGQSIEALIDAGLFRFWRTPGVSRGYLQATSRLFIDNASGFFPPPQRCQILWDGAERTVELVWTPVDLDDYSVGEAMMQADGRQSATWGITTPAPGVTWIGVPSFLDPYGEELPLELVDIVHTLSVSRDRYRRGGAIVVDLRGNGGGLVGGAYDLAEGLFGAAAGSRNRGLFMRTSTVFRISQENVDYISDRTQDRREFSDEQNALQPFAWMFMGALRNGEASLTLGPRAVRNTEGLTLQRAGSPPPPASDSAEIYVLVNETCLSACLMFLDTAAFMPGVTIIGGVTGADGALTWAREVALPEPGMWISLPMVERRGPARGAGEAYAPDIAYPGVWRDEDVRAWVMDLVTRGETARR